MNADNLAKILIPIPSQEEQARIVTILDKFDTLTNSISEGLPREIALRQKQYEHYRDLLLSFPKNHPTLTGTPPTEGNWGADDSPPMEGCPKGRVVTR